MHRGTFQSSNLNLVADLEKTDFSFLHVSGLGRMEPKEKQHEDFIATMLLGKMYSLKKSGILANGYPSVMTCCMSTRWEFLNQLC